jgi:hypothetical protein
MAILPAQVTIATINAMKRVIMPECGGRDKRGRFSLRRREDTANWRRGVQGQAAFDDII